MAEGLGERKIHYVTDLDNQLSGGGSYVVNWHAFDELRQRFDATYVGPIMPRAPRLEAAISKIRRRALRVPGTFFYFSEATLKANAREVERRTASADAIVFRSATRWCGVKPRVPYFVYLDAVFHTFFHNTFAASDFHPDDLQRIWNKEAEFLEKATGVFFESAWGLTQAVKAYGLRGNHYKVVGRGGAVSPPDSDQWTPVDRQQLLTIAMNFRQKGGDTVFEAYRRLKARFPSLAWTHVGAEPDVEWRSVAGISYEGILRPDDSQEMQRLQDLLSHSTLLLHPTREDTSPLVITEAAYFGCPAISVRKFGIPELVIDGVTGVLLSEDPTPESLANTVARVLNNTTAYAKMREAARANALKHSTWNRVGAIMAENIGRALQ